MMVTVASDQVWKFPVISARVTVPFIPSIIVTSSSNLMRCMFLFDMMQGNTGLVFFDISLLPTLASSLHTRQVASSCLALGSTFFLARYLHSFLCVLSQCSFWHTLPQYQTIRL